MFHGGLEAGGRAGSPSSEDDDIDRFRDAPDNLDAALDTPSGTKKAMPEDEGCGSQAAATRYAGRRSGTEALDEDNPDES